MITADYIVVGSGLTGATVARHLADAGRDVVVLERRSHTGGNVYDERLNESNPLRVHRYGPHYFRTSCERVWQWAQRFGEFWPYEARVLTNVPTWALRKGQGAAADRFSFAENLYPWPLQEQTLHDFGGGKTAAIGETVNFEQACLRRFPERAYNLCVKPYTERQWGVLATMLEPGLANRLTINPDGEDRLTPNAKWQGIPKDGYAAWTVKMLEGIRTLTGFDYLEHREEVEARKLLVWTGPCDAYFNCDLGPLAYRCQRREHTWYERESVQAVAQINNPMGPHVRTIEWRKLMPPDQASLCKGSITTTETPDWARNVDECEYPFPDRANRELTRQYLSRAKALDKVVFAGRLGRGQYLDMDQAIGAALKLADSILAGGRSMADGA